MENDKSRTIHLDCACYSPEHIVRYSLWDWGDREFPELSVTLQAGHYLPWYHRVWLAVKYMFGYPDLRWHEAILREEDVEKLQKMLSDYKICHEKFRKGLKNDN